MHAIREGRIQGMSGPNQLALLEHAFGLHADSEENILAQTRNRELEHETGQEMSDRNDENHNVRLRLWEAREELDDFVKNLRKEGYNI